MRVLGVGLAFVASVVAATYVVEALAPGISQLGRFAVMLPIYVGGGLCVRAAAERRRRDRRRREVS
ncbi:hypothetical protein ACQFYA_04580 [Promicromonospora sp. Marseille-Q5078]